MDVEMVLPIVLDCLSDEQKDNVRHHLQKGTGIICGKNAHYFCMRHNAGCLAALACDRELPDMNLDDVGIGTCKRPRWLRLYNEFVMRTRGGYLNAMINTDEGSLRALLRQALGITDAEAPGAGQLPAPPPANA